MFLLGSLKQAVPSLNQDLHFYPGEICQMLTAAGASVTVRNNRGETCLHRAAVGGHVEAVSAIVGR